MNEEIIFTQDEWNDSPLSIAKFYGGITFRGIHYIIVNKEGKDLFECSAEAIKAGRTKAIEPGEPADLINERYQAKYKELGRDEFLKWARSKRWEK